MALAVSAMHQRFLDRRDSVAILRRIWLIRPQSALGVPGQVVIIHFKALWSPIFDIVGESGRLCAFVSGPVGFDFVLDTRGSGPRSGECSL